MLSNKQEHKIEKFRNAALRLFAALLVPLALAGCSQTTTRIDARDKRVFLPSLRMGINLNDDRQAASEPQTGHAFEIGGMEIRGGGEQTLAAGQMPIVYNKTTYTAPELLRHDFDFSYGDISWRWRKFFNERALGLEVAAGIGYSTLDLTVSSPTQLANDKFFTRGPQAGLGLIWRLNQSSSLQGRIGTFISPIESGVTSLTRYELSYVKAMLDNVSLRLGYAGWEMYGQTPYYGSDFRLNFSGPVVSLNWDFNVRNKKIAVSRDEKVED